MQTLLNSKAITLLNKLIDDTARNGIIINTAIDDLKALRPYTIIEELPLLAKATRLAFEHLEEHQTFAVAIPEDEPIEGNEEIQTTPKDAKESFHYFLCLMRDVNKKANEADLRDYVSKLKEY